MERMNTAVKELAMEVALLIASAQGKGIDTSVWLMEGSANETSFDHFKDRLVSLSLTVGIEEDWDTKAELEVATNAKSLKNIKSLFSCGKNGNFIDVSMFLNVAQQKVTEYMVSLEASGDGESSDMPIAASAHASASGARSQSSASSNSDYDRSNASPTSTQHAIAPHYGVSATGTIVSSVGDSVEDDAWEAAEEPEDEVNMADGPDSEAESENEYRGPALSSPAVQVKNRSAANFASPSYLDLDRPGDSAKQAILPDSPYDEEVAFDLDEEEEADTADGYGKRRKNKAGAAASGVRSSEREAASKKSHSHTKGSAAQQTSGLFSSSNFSANETSTVGKKDSSASGGSPSKGGSALTLTPAEKALATMIGSSKAKAAAAASRPASAPSASQGSSADLAGKLAGNAASSSRPKAVAAVRPASASASGSALRRSAQAATSASGRLDKSALMRASHNTSTSLTSSMFPSNITDAVEEQVRHVVQHADLYHLLQVHLGFIDTYTMMPARGRAVISTPRPLLTVKELQTAFFDTRTRFSEGQILALMKLVARYACDKTGGDIDEAALTAEVIASGRRLNSEWLKKYLVHLRLTRKKPIDAAAGAESFTRTGSSLENVEGVSSNFRASASKERENPLEFNDWLGAKRVEDRKEASSKPKEFQKAMAGMKHGLSKDELERYIAQNSIIPADVLKEEVTLRVQAWIVDITGRKDFLHAWNVAVRKWNKDNAEDFRRLKDERKKQVTDEIREGLLRTYAEGLRKAEKEKQFITKQLFWRFQRDCSKRPASASPSTWGQWLSKHQGEQSKLVAQSKRDAEERRRAMLAKKQRKQAVAPLNEIEKKFNEAAEKLKPVHCMELRKRLVSLRKLALVASARQGDTVLVTKELFDSQMAQVLAPRMMELAPEVRGLAEEARRSHEAFGNGTAATGQFAGVVDSIFSKEEANATAKAVEITAAGASKAAAEFADWKARKQLQAEAAAKDAAEKASRAEAEKKKQRKIANKAYNTWLKLRKSGQYISRVDRQVHSVPDPHRPDHEGRWSKDVEVVHPEVSYL
jgi:hypothetical protein